MPQRCTVCAHANRAEIDRALVANAAGVRNIATRYGVSASAVQRHSEKHLPARLTQAQDAAAVADANDLLAQLDHLREQSGELWRVARGVLAKAIQRNDLRTAVAAVNAANGVVREQRGHAELQHKVLETAEVIRRLDELEALAEPEKGKRK